MNKKQLASGTISVWIDGEQVILHHANGLTIALTEQEAQELKTWLEQWDADWAERAEHLNHVQEEA